MQRATLSGFALNRPLRHDEELPVITNKTVLVIDDVASILEVIRGALADYPVDVVTASDGETGLRLARELRPDVVLLDLALPVRDGWEVLAALKEDAATASIPVVIVTAYGDSDNAAKARQMKASGFLSKPFRPTELRRHIDRYLSDAAPLAG